MGLLGQPVKQTENLTHLSLAFVPRRNLGVGLCGQPNHTEKCLNYARCFYSLSSAEDYEASGLDLGGIDLLTDLS